MKKDLICIVCPIGCNLTVEYTDGVVQSVSDALCRKGERYAEDEIVNPTRVLTTVVEVIGGEAPLVSAKTDRPVPKRLLIVYMQAIAELQIQAPVGTGSIVAKNLLGTEANLITTGSVRSAER